MIMNRLSIGLPLQAWVEKIIDGVEIRGLSGKEKVPLSKEGHAESFLGHEKTPHY